MDVFIEVGAVNKELSEKIFDITWEIGFKHFMVISTLIFTRDELENSPLRSSSIIKNIGREGVTVLMIKKRFWPIV